MYQFHVNPSRTDGGMNILPVFCNIKKGQTFTPEAKPRAVGIE